MATPNGSEESPRRELLELEHAFWNAMKVRDGKTATRLADTTTIVVGPQGIGEVPRDGLGDMMEHADWKLERFDIDPAKVQFKMIDDDVAVVAYEVEEKVIIDGKPTSLTAYDTSVWVRKVGKWVCAMHTETLAGDPFGRDRISH
jgi:hypothetical protein